jgi:hypothetical protein
MGSWFALSRRDIARMRSLFRSIPTVTQSDAYLGVVLAAVLAFAANTIVTYVQASQARKTQRVDHRIVAIRELSELIYRRGPALEEKLLATYEDVESALSTINSNAVWPMKASGSTLAEMEEAERVPKKAIDGAIRIRSDEDGFISDAQVESAALNSLFKRLSNASILSDVPQFITESLEQREPPPEKVSLSPVPPLSGKPLIVKRFGNSGIMSKEAREHINALNTNTREINVHYLQSAKDDLRSEDQTVRDDLRILYEKMKFAIQHLEE